MNPNELPRRLGELDPKRYRAVGVRAEIRRNLARKIRGGEPLFDGVIGFEETVIPQVVNALLAQHDIILLGLRGQAKTRLCRRLTEFLDPWTPVVGGCPLRSHLHSAVCCSLVLQLCILFLRVDP